MIVRYRAALTLALACTAVATVTASVPLARKAIDADNAGMISRSAFLTPADLADVEISPTGKYVGFLKRDGERRSLWLLDLANGNRRKLAGGSEATDVQWSQDGEWLFVSSPRALSAIRVRGSGGGMITQLGRESGRSVLGVDHSRRATMLVREAVTTPGARKPSLFRVLRVSPTTPPELIFSSRDPVDQFVSGRSAFARIVAGDHFSVHEVESPTRSREVLKCVRLQQCSLLSSPRRGELLLTGDVGSNLERLLMLNRAGVLKILHQDPTGVADLSAVDIDPLSAEPVLASYRSTQAADYAIQPSYAPHVAAIRRQLANESVFRLGIGSANWLVAETGDRLQHPRWHVYNPTTQRLRTILEDVARLDRSVPAAILAERKPVSFRASDGMLIHGFLAIPKGREPSQLPLLVHVHGGPWSHVEDGYSTMTQFLVSRGYAVFEPNFRGSTGHGRAYMFSGKQDFGNGRVQRDIEEGAQYLLARGIGDPSRVGIIGSSFGGYSALQGATFSPQLFRAAVAAMPPSDFGWVIRWQVRREAAVGHEGVGLRRSLKALGLDPADPRVMNDLSAQSPLANAARLRRPTLIIAGGQDTSVPIRSVTSYAARLRTPRRPITLFVDPKSGHRIEDPEAQEQFLYLVATMLHKYLGGAQEPRLGARQRALLTRKLRVDDLALAASSGWRTVRLSSGRD